MSKVPLLLFSGGLDSSYMLQEALMESDVETLYISASQCPIKTAKELAAREKIIDKLERVCQYKVRRDHVVEIPKFLNGNTPDHKFIQPLLWINGALNVSDGCDRHSELRIGYVSGDSIMVNLSNVMSVWDQAQYFTKWHPIPVVFPLMYKTKDDILNRLNPHVWKDIWVCEMPKAQGERHIKCGQCKPCLTMSATLHVYEKKHKETYAARNAKLLKGFKLPTLRQAMKRKMNIEPKEMIQVEAST